VGRQSVTVSLPLFVTNVVTVKAAAEVEPGHENCTERKKKNFFNLMITYVLRSR
jgi:hypothetical protein